MLFYSLVELRLIDKIKKKYSDALHWHLVLIETILFVPGLFYIGFTKY
jgi:hypothetical protein